MHFSLLCGDEYYDIIWTCDLPAVTYCMQELTVRKTARVKGLPFSQLVKGLLSKISLDISVLLLRIKVWQNCNGKNVVHFVSLALLHHLDMNPPYVVL